MVGSGVGEWLMTKRTRAARAKPASRDPSTIGIVVNRCWGGFSISEVAVLWMRKNAPCDHKETIWGEYYDDGSGPVVGQRYVEIYGSEEEARKNESYYEHGQYRDCPSLLKAVQVLGSKAFGRLSELEIVAVPSDAKWEIDDYDGMEKVCEKHREW